MTDKTAPIYIASKGRPEGQTFQLLRDCGLPYTVVVEPQDALAYAEAGHPEVVQLDKDDQGLAYVRQVILDQARALGGWVWVLDDDITGFYVRTGPAGRGRLQRCTAALALTGAEHAFRNVDGVRVAALGYQQFVWSARYSYALNSYCDVAVALHGDLPASVRFDPAMGLKCDRDIVLQILSLGLRSLRWEGHAFSAPKNGSNAGGLSPVYAEDGREAADSRAMCAKWGEAVCTFQTKPDGRPDVRINWRLFKP